MKIIKWLNCDEMTINTSAVSAERVLLVLVVLYVAIIHWYLGGDDICIIASLLWILLLHGDKRHSVIVPIGSLRFLHDNCNRCDDIVCGTTLLPLLTLSLSWLSETESTSALWKSLCIVSILVGYVVVASFLWKRMSVLAVTLVAIGASYFCDSLICYLALTCLFVLRSLIVVFPGSFSLSEAMIVSQGLSFVTFDAIATVSAHHNMFLSYLPNIYYDNLRPIRACLQVITVGSLLSVITITLSILLLSRFLKLSPSSLLMTFAVMCSFGMIFAIVLTPWLQNLLPSYAHPVLWVISFVVGEPRRIFLVLYWVCVLGVFLPLLWTFLLRVGTAVPTTIIRKYFHLLIILIFVPGVVVDPSMLELGLGVALSLLILIETIRVWELPPLGPLLQTSFAPLLDSRDSNSLILTHIYLLIGCSVPLWLTSVFSSTRNLSIPMQLLPYAGLLTLGVGDTAASVIGRIFGRTHWFHISSKTVEGTLSAIIAQVTVILLFWKSGFLQGDINFVELSVILFGIIMSSLMEAFTFQIDNLVLPLFLTALWLFGVTITK